MQNSSLEKNAKIHGCATVARVSASIMLGMNARPLESIDAEIEAVRHRARINRRFTQMNAENDKENICVYLRYLRFLMSQSKRTASSPSSATRLSANSRIRPRRTHRAAIC